MVSRFGGIPLETPQSRFGGIPVAETEPEPAFSTPEAAARRRAELGKTVTDFGRGLLKGGKEVVGGVLQTGADIAGALFPESAGVQEFRELLPEAVQRSRQQFEAQTMGSTAGKVGEFIGEAAPFVAAIPAGAATLAGRVGVGVLGGAIAGGTGATEEQLTPGQALIQRGKAATIGGAIGGAIPAALSGITRGGTRLIKGREADKILSSKITKDEAAQALGEIKKGKISILADVAGDELQGFTRLVGKQKGGARNIISDALENRSDAAVGRISRVLAKDVSNIDTYFANIDDIAKARSAVASPLYSKAYNEATNIDRVKLNRLLQDKRIVTALEDAKANLGVRLEANANSLEALDGAKKSLDDIIGTAKRAGQNQKAASFIRLKKQLLEELDAASPTYKKARKVFSDFSSLESAQQAGLGFTKETPEQLSRFLKDLDSTQKEAFKIGVRENLQRIVNKTADQADPAKRIFGNKFKREQLKAIFGEGDQFEGFSKALREEMRAAKTKFKILGGSRTDINMADDGQFIVAASQAVRQGVVVTTITKITDFLATLVKKQWYGLNHKNAKELAKILTDKKAGAEALQRLVNQASKPQKALVQDATSTLGVALGLTAATGVR